MSTVIGEKGFEVPTDVSHIEIASIHYDQWLLTIGIRKYEQTSEALIGITHLVFKAVDGFRMLDEGAMLQFPWPEPGQKPYFLYAVSGGGWLDQERQSDNLVAADCLREFLVMTDNECVSVMAKSPPQIIHG